MLAEIFPILASNTEVTSRLGSSPVRIFPYGSAPQNVAKPYATYGTYSGVPENYMDRVPDIDNIGTQINIWGENSADVVACFTAIRDALEPYGHMTSFQSINRDNDTQLFTSQMEFDFWTTR